MSTKTMSNEAVEFLRAMGGPITVAEAAKAAKAGIPLTHEEATRVVMNRGLMGAQARTPRNVQQIAEAVLGGGPLVVRNVTTWDCEMACPALAYEVASALAAVEFVFRYEDTVRDYRVTRLPGMVCLTLDRWTEGAGGGWLWIIEQA